MMVKRHGTTRSFLGEQMGASGEHGGQDPAEQEPRLVADGLVDRLVADPGQHEPLVCLTGYMGHGAAEGVWRLYLNRQLDEYLEFNGSDVSHTEPVAGGGSPAEATRVWLRIGTTIRHTRVSSRQVQAEFLQGGLASSFMPRSGLMAPLVMAGENTGPGCTHNYVCSTNHHIPACQDYTEACGSLGCDPSLGCAPPSTPPCG
jgi:hypothetical protein